MDNSFTMNEDTLRRMPQFLVLVIILLLGLPYLGLNLGLDFSAISNKINQELKHDHLVNSAVFESQIRGYFRQTLLQWSAFSLASITVLLAFTQYRLSNDKLSLIIGLSILFSGSLESLHTLLIDGLSLTYSEKTNLDAFIWIFSNSMEGFILVTGLSLLIYAKKATNFRFTSFVLLTILLVLTAITLIYYAASVIQIPTMWYKDYYLSRPYELIPISIYLVLILFIYPKAYKAYPNILTDCIFYMAITQVIISIYLFFLSQNPYDSAYNIAYFLKVVSYFIPCTCLVINYVFSYASVLMAQKKLKLKQEELQYLAAHDSLTGLFNRREFEDLLNQSIANASRNKTLLALLLIDLDNFKTTNDTFGHVHGDELLKQFSGRLSFLTRKGDVLSRVGGDEFTLISRDLITASSARQLAERILNELTNSYTINGKLITVTASIGISMFPEDGLSSDDLLRKADMAMYKAKSSGKNTFQFYTSQLSYLQHRESEVEAHLRKAMLNNELSLYYQPKFDLASKEIKGAEVLLRWHSKALGDISPNEFIHVAERTGLIIDMGLWILLKTCEQIVAWTQQYNRAFTFAVNISPTQLVNNQFIPNIERILKDYQFPTQFLEIEITENLLVAHNDDINQVLERVSAMGIRISLDDFGKEYSSLNRLNSLPIDTLKIDKIFVADITDENQKVVIIDIIIKLAKELGMDIVAEGIETQTQLDYLITNGCEYGQGFLLSKPLTASEFEKIAFTRPEKSAD